MLTRCCIVSVAISLQKIPDATSSHGGSAHCLIRTAVTAASSPASAAIRARKAVLQRRTAAARTSLGQKAKLSTTGRSASSSCRHCEHDAMCASICSCFVGRKRLHRVGGYLHRIALHILRSRGELTFSVLASASACLSFCNPERIRVFIVPRG